MHVSDLIARLHECVGVEVAAEGVLIVGNDSRLVASPDAPDELCVLLPHLVVRNRLLAQVPPWGGGRYIYHEDATVLGEISDGPPRFKAIRKLIVRREDQVYELTKFK